jgi:Asp-tRNA(Asn)/Glu-tRNA(Gln) amidotransferase A subunit family amidase
MREGMRTASACPRQYADACERRVRRALDVAAAAERALTTAVLAWRRDEALAEARAWDRAVDTPPLFGVVLSTKACIDMKGWVTHAGSRVLADSPPARHDAPIVTSLRAAGAVILAQTNMTEFVSRASG